MSEDTSSASKHTNTRLNEMMEKTASRMKRDAKIVVSSEGEDTFEETAAAELTNPNDEVWRHVPLSTPAAALLG
jgi:hypothetical protein